MGPFVTRLGGSMEPQKPQSSIALIGAGLPRTGTLTQKLALEELGLGPTYHWVNVLADLDHVGLWSSAMDGQPDWDEIFGEHRSTVDWPGGYFYRELADAYPEAKVLLSVRDPEAWERSFRDTIWTMSHGDSVMPLLAHARAEIDPRWDRYLKLVDRMFWGPEGTFSAGHAEPAQMIEQALAHNEAVKQAIAPERLLVWEVGEGWEPLCEFLGVPVPDTPMPHANERGVFVERVVGAALDALDAWRAESLNV
jgi:Sulfotransferase domain